MAAQLAVGGVGKIEEPLGVGDAAFAGGRVPRERVSVRAPQGADRAQVRVDAVCLVGGGGKRDCLAGVVVGGRPPAFHLLAEMIFDNRADLDAALASEAGIESARDLRNFAGAGVTLLVVDDAAGF